jgi:hypothetical protein
MYCYRVTLSLKPIQTLLFFPYLKACHYVNIQPNIFELDQLTNFDVFFLVMGFILGPC